MGGEVWGRGQNIQKVKMVCMGWGVGEGGGGRHGEKYGRQQSCRGKERCEGDIRADWRGGAGLYGFYRIHSSRNLIKFYN